MRQTRTGEQGALNGATLPAEKKQGMMAGQAANFELFKHVCETNPA